MTDADQRLRDALGDLPTDAATARDVEDHWQVATYAKWPIVLARGKGSWVEDVAGTRYLDLYGGHCVALPGHCHPRLVAAIQAQAERLVFYSNVLYVDVRALAVERLAALAPPGLARVFLCSTGTEANETAIKIARKHTKRRVIVSMQEGFHGRTLGSLGATGLPTYRDPAYPIPTEHRYVPYGDEAALLAALDEDVAGVILEPIPSMGGIQVAPASWFQALRRRADAVGALVIFDEVQTGFGRTGTFFFGEQVGVTPDLITGAKGVAGGFPVGVTFVREDLAAHITKGEQGTTFGGGPLAAAAIAATARILTEEKLPANAERVGRVLRRELERVPGVVGTRGAGLLIGVDLDRPSAPVVRHLLEEHHILTGTSGDPKQMRLLPPLTLTEKEALLLVPALASVLEAS
ncbi:MAG: aspartate aminotransferase family protein [Planctomycetes bacterium]|nr:aspartate aminotransferase family protein [Planctomycetota bacterium]MCB9825750.1 aspartate aminotransferase family protein [Planctomycetota bacterium]MCB9830001.1 aspartate aminotransferase family protein [Planctomycetota bacterium]